MNPFAREAFSEVLEKAITFSLERAESPDVEKIDRRKAPGSPWRVRLKPIGSWDHPNRYGELLAAQVSARLSAEARIRSELVSRGRLEELTRESPDTAAQRLRSEVEAAVSADPGFKRAIGEHNNTILVEGLEGGEAEVRRLYDLGGWRLLAEVLDEIHAYHTLDHETGEG